MQHNSHVISSHSPALLSKLRSRLTATLSENWTDRIGRLWLAALTLWLVTWIATPIGLWVAGETIFPLLASCGVIAHTLATLISLAARWDALRIARTALLVAILAWLVERLGSVTDFPFGPYHYTPLLQPQLGGVPLLIALAWLMMLGPAWGVAAAILAPWQERLGRWYRLVLSGLAGLAFTAWDLYLDPQMVARGLWVWERPGAYFGIPLINFVGWWLASTVMTFLLHPLDLPRSRLMVIYMLTWLFQAVGLGIFWGQPGPALFGLIGMGIFVVPGWIQEAQQW